jgi:hypothetical protein
MGMGGTTMTTTSAQRVRAHRARCHRREFLLTIEVSEADLRDIALAGYPGAASTDRIARAQAVRSSSATWTPTVTGRDIVTTCNAVSETP